MVKDIEASLWWRSSSQTPLRRDAPQDRSESPQLPNIREDAATLAGACGRRNRHTKLYTMLRPRRRRSQEKRPQTLGQVVGPKVIKQWARQESNLRTRVRRGSIQKQNHAEMPMFAEKVRPIAGKQIPQFGVKSYLIGHPTDTSVAMVGWQEVRVILGFSRQDGIEWTP